MVKKLKKTNDILSALIPVIITVSTIITLAQIIYQQITNFIH